MYKGFSLKGRTPPPCFFFFFYPFLSYALPSSAVLFAVFNQVLQIRALIYKDASAIVAL